MISIDWNQFRIKNRNQSEAFEELCYYLFCRKFKITDGIPADFNQTGLETEPILCNSKYYGFQAKFFGYTTKYPQIKHSVKLALKTYKGRLDCIYIYMNTKSRVNSSKGAKNIEDIAKKKGVEIKWITRSNFKSLLNQPANLNLAQLYFGVGDEIGFTKNSFPPKIGTLLQSSEYIDLPLREQNSGGSIMLSRLKEEILNSKDKVFLITGHPGSGKSISMYKLFQKFGGLDQEDAKKMHKAIGKNKALPMIINLKDCASDTLENIIRNRKRDYKLKGRDNYKFIYLFDGLDEVSEERIGSVLTYINFLGYNNTTKKIIISSRLSTMNLAKIKTYEQKSTEFKINDLSVDYIDKYFIAKNDKKRLKRLKNLRQNNTNIHYH